MADLKVGSVVQLKSGGPKMTVANTSSNPEGILCVWFAATEVKSSRFPVEALEPAKKAPKKAAPVRRRRKLPLDDLD